jgi:hypothetical protein
MKPMTAEKHPVSLTMPSYPTQVQLIVVNLTQDPLVVTGYLGTDLSNVACGPQAITYGESLVVAQLNYKPFDEQYDWVFMADLNNSSTIYQIYFERTPLKNIYQSFGYCDSSSSEKSANPSPFPSGCEDVLFQAGGLSTQYDFAYYVLRAAPPPADHCSGEYAGQGCAHQNTSKPVGRTPDDRDTLRESSGPYCAGTESLHES